MGRNRDTQGGFTLVEVMAVVLIVGLLGILVGTNVKGALDRAKRARTVAQIAMIEAALESYQIEANQYPSTEEGLGVLVPRFLRRQAQTLDGWNRRFQYRRPAEQSPFPYDLWSWGQDGEPGGEDLDADVLGWDAPGESA